MSTQRSLVRIAVVACVLAALAGTASAHEVGSSRFDAPIPLLLLYGGAGATVAITAGWLGYAGEPRGSLDDRRRLATVGPTTATRLRIVLRSVFFLAVGLAIVHGIVGRRVPAENLATVFVWPVWIKGVALVSILAGSPWGVLSPWETIYDGLVRLEGTEIAVLGTYPDRLGTWPAVAGFVFGIGILENLTLIPRVPRLTAGLVAGYALVMVLGGVLFGREWFRNADTLAVLYRLFGRVAPVGVERTDDGGYRVDARLPWVRSSDAVEDASVVVFVVATVYTVSFDGFTNTQVYQTLLFDARDALGTGSGTSVLLYLAGLVGFIAAFVLASALARRLGSGSARPAWASAAGFGATVLPIAAGYELAHNYPFVVRNVGQLVTVAGDLLVGHGPTVAPLAWLPLSVFWASQVVLIVGGHVVAVVAAHRVARSQFDTMTAARRGHLPLVVVMVGYTVVSLWIVSSPVVT